MLTITQKYCWLLLLLFPSIFASNLVFDDGKKSDTPTHQLSEEDAYVREERQEVMVKKKGLMLDQINGALKIALEENPKAYIIYDQAMGTDWTVNNGIIQRYYKEDIKREKNYQNLDYIAVSYAINDQHQVALLVQNPYQNKELIIIDSLGKDRTKGKPIQDLAPKLRIQKIKKGRSNYKNQSNDWECGLHTFFNIKETIQNIQHAKSRLELDQNLQEVLKYAFQYQQIEKINPKIAKKDSIVAGKQLEYVKNLSRYSVKEPASINLSTRLRGTNVLDDKEAFKRGFNKNNKIVQINAFHFSSHSDKWYSDKNYAGIILYQYYGKTNWYCNNIHCTLGYIIIRDATKVQDIQEKSGLFIHGKVYKSVFGEDFNSSRIQVSGFAYYNGKWRYRSWSCNALKDAYHDGNKSMNDTEIAALSQTINHWIKTGMKNYDVSRYNLALYKDSSYPDPNASIFASNLVDDEKKSDTPPPQLSEEDTYILEEREKVMKQEDGLGPDQVNGALKVALQQNTKAYIIYDGAIGTDWTVNNGIIQRYYKEDIKREKNCQNLDYIAVSYAINDQHQVALLVRNPYQNKELIIIDSLGKDRTKDEPIQDLAPKLGIQKVKKGRSNYYNQSNDWECGLHTFFNIKESIQNIQHANKKNLELDKNLTEILQYAFRYQEIESKLQMERDKNRNEKEDLLKEIEDLRKNWGCFDNDNAQDVLSAVADTLQLELWGNKDRKKADHHRTLEQTTNIRERKIDELIKDYENKNLNDIIGIIILNVFKTCDNLASAASFCKLALKNNMFGLQDAKKIKTEEDKLHNLGNVFLYLGQYAKSLPFYTKAAKIKKRKFGKNSDTYATTLSKIAEIYSKQGNYTMANSTLEQLKNIPNLNADQDAMKDDEKKIDQKYEALMDEIDKHINTTYQYNNNNLNEIKKYVEPSQTPIYKYDQLKDYQRFEELICAGNKCIQDAITMSKQSKKIFLVIGPIRAGKSTIINSFLGNPLEIREIVVQYEKSNNNLEEESNGYSAYSDSEEEPKDKVIVLKKDDTQGSMYPSIGSSDIRSETLFPSAYTSNSTDGVFIDTPGFFHNRGAVEQLFAVEFIKMCLTALKIHSIIIVISKDSLICGGGIFKEAIANIGYLFFQIQEKTGIEQEELKKNTFLIINKTKNQHDYYRARENLEKLTRQIHNNFTKIENTFSDEDYALELKHQNIFFDIFSVKNDNYRLDKQRVLYPPIKWITEGKLRKLVFKVTEKNATFFIGMNSLSRPTLVKPDGAVAGCITEFCKRTYNLYSKCETLFYLFEATPDNIIESNSLDLKNELEKKIFNKIKKNEKKIKLLQKKTDQVVVIRYLRFFKRSYSSPYIEPKDPVGAITYKCSYVRLTSYDLGIFNYQCRNIGLQIDCSESEVEGKKQFKSHSTQKFGFWAYPTRSQESKVIITGYCNYNQTKGCKLQISELQKEIIQLNKCIHDIRNFKKNKNEFKELFEKLLIESANTQEKSIAPYKLKYYLTRFNEKINMLERWTKLIYAGDNSQSAAKELNLQVVKNLKKIKYFYINHFQ